MVADRARRDCRQPGTIVGGHLVNGRSGWAMLRAAMRLRWDLDMVIFTVALVVASVVAWLL